MSSSLAVLAIGARTLLDAVGHFTIWPIGPSLALVAALLCLPLWPLALQTRSIRLMCTSLLGYHVVQCIGSIQAGTWEATETWVRDFASMAPVLIIALHLAGRPVVDRKTANIACIAYLAGTGALSIFVLLETWGLRPYQYYDWTDIGKVGRPTGGYVHPSCLGRAGLFAIVFTYLLSAHYPKHRTWACFVVGYFLAITFLSSHRSSFAWAIAMVAACEATHSLRLIINRRFHYRLPALILGAALLLGASQMSTPESPDSTPGAIQEPAGILEKITSIYWYTTQVSFDPSNDAFLRGRGGMWRQTWEDFSGRPIQMRMFGGTAPLEAHNDYLRVLLTAGFIGLLGMGCTLAILFWKTVSFSHGHRLVVCALFGGLSVYALLLHPTNYPQHMQPFLLTILLLCMRQGTKISQPTAELSKSNGDNTALQTATDCASPANIESGDCSEAQVAP